MNRLLAALVLGALSGCASTPPPVPAVTPVVYLCGTRTEGDGTTRPVMVASQVGDSIELTSKGGASWQLTVQLIPCHASRGPK